MVSTSPLISMSSSPCTNPGVNVPRARNYNWYNCHFHVPQFFQFSSKVLVFIFTLSFSFTLGSARTQLYKSSFFFVNCYKVWSSDSRLGDPSASQNPRGVCGSYFPITDLLFNHLEFFTEVLADGFSLEFEWQQISRTLLSILAVFYHAFVWIVSSRPPTSKSSSPFHNP